jgi:16S rRNA (guanine1207-N2)-methyltransferase
MPHYYSENQTSDLQLIEISISFKGVFFKMFSGSGVFSKKKLDKGTEILLKYMILKDNSEVLDLGCGIGVVGVYAAKINQTIHLTLSDVNRRATILARKNLDLNNLKGRVKQSDGFQKIKEEFDTILLNPPQVAGKEVCFKLITESYHHLKKEGNLQIVARHNKGGKSYSEHMLKIFGNMKEIGKSAGYRVYLSQK